LRIQVPAGDTRPTTDRVREAVFSKLEHGGIIEQAGVLDLFSGSGALGFEAISRGARRATLVDSAKAANRCATANAQTLGVTKQVLVVNDDAVRYSAAMSRGGGLQGVNLRIAPHDSSISEDDSANAQRALAEQAAMKSRAVDLVFLDPPYDYPNAHVEQILANLLRCQLMPQGSVIVVERGTRTPELTLPAGLQAEAIKKYGETVVYFLTVSSGPVLPDYHVSNLGEQ
jgi:16S rRNA (guanine966-N2)-methyltransferase